MAFPVIKYVHVPKREPLPKLWPYKQEDRRTWKYLDCMVGDSSGDPIVTRWIDNPQFAYSHLERINKCR